MSILRAASREVAGAWRSLRYDIVRRPGSADSPADGYPDVTSGGLSTFGGQFAEGLALEPHERPRRLLAASAFVVLVLAGAGGSYLAVVNGLGAIAASQAAPPPPEPLPLAGQLGGRAVEASARPVPRRVAETVPPVREARATFVPVAPDVRVTAPASVRPIAPPVPTPCRCPVPTPAPSNSPTPSGSSGASPSGTGSASASPSVTPTESYTDPRGTYGY